MPTKKWVSGKLGILMKQNKQKKDEKTKSTKTNDLEYNIQGTDTNNNQPQFSDEIDIFQHLNVLLEERGADISNSTSQENIIDDDESTDELVNDPFDTNILDIISKDNDIEISTQNENEDLVDQEDSDTEDNKYNINGNPITRNKYISEISFECSRLASENNWSELTNYTENATQSAQGEDLYFARLWWITAQIEANSMPLGILAGPLDTVSKEIIEKKSELSHELLYLAEGILIKVAKKLLNTDIDMANLFYERAIKINPKNVSEFTDILKTELNELLLAPQTKSNIEKVSYLKSKIAEYGESYDAANNKENVDKISEKVLVTTFNNSIPNVSENHSEKNNGRLSFFILILLLGAISFFLSRNYPNFLLENLGIKQIKDLFSSSKQKGAVFYSEVFIPINFSYDNFILPEIIPLNVPKRNSLGGVLRDLNNSNIKSQHNEKVDFSKVLENKSKDEVNEILLAELINTQKIKNQDITLDSVNAKSSGVNTHSPIEPEELKELVNKAENGELDINERTSTKENNDKFDRVTKPIVAGHSKTDPIVPAYMIPQDTNLNTEMYEINGYAEVLSEPRGRAPKVATLISGDRIRVESIRGDWVKIVSQSGRPGYILKSALGRRVLDIDNSFRQ